MKHFKTATAAAALMAVGLLWASTGEAQVFKKPKVTKTPTVKQPLIPFAKKQENEELQLLQITNPEEYGIQKKPILHLSEVPEIGYIICGVWYVTITPKSYIFQCSSQRQRHYDYSKMETMWVIRRDGSQPRWALPAKDADQVYKLMSEKLLSTDGTPIKYWMYTKKNSRADNQYCNRNSLDLTGVKPLSTEEQETGSGYEIDWIGAKYEGHNDYNCYDIMSITRLAGG